MQLCATIWSQARLCLPHKVCCSLHFISGTEENIKLFAFRLEQLAAILSLPAIFSKSSANLTLHILQLVHPMHPKGLWFLLGSNFIVYFPCLCRSQHHQLLWHLFFCRPPSVWVDNSTRWKKETLDVWAHPGVQDFDSAACSNLPMHHSDQTHPSPLIFCVLGAEGNKWEKELVYEWIPKLCF